MLSLAAILIGSPAAAHDVVGSYGLRPFVRDGVLIGGFTTWGPARVEADGYAYRVCEEALLGLRDVWLRDDGVFVGASASGLWTSADGACTTEPAGIEDPVSALAALGDLLVAVVEADGGDVLLVSTDELRTWETVALPIPTDVRSLALAGDGTWWVAGLSDGQPALLGGAPGALAPAPLPDPDAVAVVVHGIAPDGAGLALSTVGSDGAAALWARGADGDTRLADLPLAATGYGCLAERCLVALNGSVLLGWDRASPAPVAPEIVEGPARCLFLLDDALWGCTALDRPGHFERTADGRTFASEMPRIAVFDRDCPAGTVGAEACTVFDTGAKPPTEEDPGDSAPEAPEPGGRCGCASGQRAAAWVLWAPIGGLALLRRRERSARARVG